MRDLRSTRTITALLVIVTASFLTVLSSQITQAQSLPTSSWYAVVWSQNDDTLHWVNAQGEQTSIPRPKLPGETADATPQFNFSRDGRYAVISAPLESGVDGIGIYDIASGQFVQTHQAQPDEEISLNPQVTSNLASQWMAVGFAVNDADNPAWRLIIFNLSTGDAITQLDSSNPVMSVVEPYSLPFVTHYTVDSGLNQDVVHFQMIPLGGEVANTFPAFAWYPEQLSIISSPYTQADGDILPTTGEVVTAFADPGSPQLPAPTSGTNHNAVGRGFPQTDQFTPTPIFIDGARYHYSARWANNGEWVLFWTDDGQNTKNWNVIQANSDPASNTRNTVAPNVLATYGTPDGYLMVTENGEVYFTSSFSDTTGSLLFRTTSSQPVSVVYVSPESGAFELAAVGTPDVTTASIPPTIDTNDATTIEDTAGDSASAGVVCPDTQPSRVSMGMRGRVIITSAPLRVRNQPGGSIITEIASGTEFEVIGGPECLNGFTWWQIRFQTNTGQLVDGWSAESDSTSYYIEPLTSATAPSADDETALMEDAPAATAEADGATIADAFDEVSDAASCDLAPPTRLEAGMTVSTVTDDSLEMWTNPQDESPSFQVPGNLLASIIDEPTCVNGYRLWHVRLSLSGNNLTGWISEGTADTYYLVPIE